VHKCSSVTSASGCVVGTAEVCFCARRKSAIDGRFVGSGCTRVVLKWREQAEARFQGRPVWETRVGNLSKKGLAALAIQEDRGLLSSRSRDESDDEHQISKPISWALINSIYFVKIGAMNGRFERRPNRLAIVAKYGQNADQRRDDPARLEVLTNWYWL